MDFVTFFIKGHFDSLGILRKKTARAVHGKFTMNNFPIRKFNIYIFPVGIMGLILRRHRREIGAQIKHDFVNFHITPEIQPKLQILSGTACPGMEGIYPVP